MVTHKEHRNCCTQHRTPFFSTLTHAEFYFGNNAHDHTDWRELVTLCTDFLSSSNDKEFPN
jgi:hypothetical protein